MSMNVGNVGNTDNYGKRTDNTRPNTIKIKQGENLTIIAKRFGMTKYEFAKWVGLKKGYIRVGQTITLPTAVAESGKGIYAVARKYGMTMAEFSKMNNIQDPNNYQAKAGEVFYVKPKKSEQKSSKKVDPTKVSTKIKKNTKADLSKGAEIGMIIGKATQWGSAYSPEELAQKIYEIADDKWAAVGRPDFDALIDEINPKNASAVIEAYTQNEKNKNKVSLINTITSEVMSTPNARKAAVMKVYDALAEEKGAPKEKRKEFLDELNTQFDKFGKVDTTKLDKLIGEVLEYVKFVPYSINFDRNKVTEYDGNRKVVVPNSKHPQTVASLKRGSIHSTKQEALSKFKEFCTGHGIKYDPNMLDMSPLDRVPNPVLASNGKIIPFVSELLRPVGKPNGKVIVLNSGHGGYNPNNGVFDVGSYNFVMKAHGKYAPHLEYDKVQPYINDMVDKLRQQGYAVVVTQGSYIAYSNTKTLTHLYNDLASGKKANGYKYDKKDVAFVSFHADSSELVDDKNDKSSVCYKPGFSSTKALADSINHHLNTDKDTWVESELAQRIPGTNGVYILNESSPQVPTVLLETAHINGVNGRKNLDAAPFREKFTNSVVLGLNEYFGVGQR